MKSFSRPKQAFLPALLSVTLACCILFYLFLGIFFFCNSLSSDTTAADLQESIADEVLRLHIIADSNSDADQNIKLQIKEEVITYLEPLLQDVTTKEEATAIIQTQLGALEEIADRILQEAGFSYRSEASITRSYFPIKTYGDLTLPAGEYDALKICLGSASGKNWWCLVFPKLCFADVTYGTLPEESRAELRALLTEEEYAAILSDTAYLADSSIEITPAATKSKTPVIRFGLWELLKEWFE